MTPGTSIGPYEIVGWLGAGGMGEVYRARDPRLGRDVAIKIIPAALAADPSRLHRFEQEARAAGQLNHPNILAVHDVGTHQGSPYIVSELLEGASLREMLAPEAAARTADRGAALPVRKAIDYARQIAEGLAAAHDKGIVHRDLKPDNLFVTRDGRVKILDFGIAKLTLTVDDAARPTGFATDTEPGTVVGTAGYMSPEQVRGEGVDARSDLFSFGAVLYEMLTGRRAFTRPSAAETLAAILKEEPPEPLPPTASPALARIVTRCLEKSREARFQSARDLAFGLEVLSGDTAATSAPAIAAPRPRWRIALGIAAVVLALAAVAGWLTRNSAPPSIESLLANATFTPVTESEASEQDAVISPDGKLIAFLADSEGPFHVWLRMVGTTQFTNLTPGAGDQRSPAQLRSVGFSPDSSEVWISAPPDIRMKLVPVMGGGEPRVFLTERTVNVAWSRDGQRLAYFTFDEGDAVFVADGKGDNAKQILVGGAGEHREHNHFLAWSVDDRFIYYTHGGQVGTESDVWRIPSVDGTGKEERLTHHNSNVRYVTPIDARTVLYVAPDEYSNGPWLWALDVERKVTRRVSVGLERYLSVSASADGRRLVATVANSTARLWSVPILKDGAGESDVRPNPPSTVRALAPRFGKDSSLFYLSSSGPGDGLWRFRDGKSVEIWKGSDGAMEGPAEVSPAGDRLALVLRKQGKQYLTLVSADGATRSSLPEVIDVRGSPAWSPDARSIAIGGTDADGPGLFIIPVDGGTPRRIVKGPAFDPVWSPLGTLIVYAGTQGASAPLLAVDPADPGRPTSFPAISVPFGGAGRSRFLPDGKGLVFLRGSVGSYDFWLLDLTTNEMRAITRLSNPATISAFDIAPDGRHIVFDRIRENSDIRLIDLK